MFTKSFHAPKQKCFLPYIASCMCRGESHDQVRKKPHILYWVKGLMNVKNSGGNVMTTIALWDQSQSMCEADQLKRPKRDAVINLVNQLPKEVLEICLEHVDDVGDFQSSGNHASILGATPNITHDTMGKCSSWNDLSIHMYMLPSVQSSRRQPWH